MTQHDSSGVYYFLGNMTSHIIHALPLYEKLGGTFVVTSNEARNKIENIYKVPVINVDNKPFKWMWPGKRPKRIHEYAAFDNSLKKTYQYLNKNAKVVIFYELFEIEKPEWLDKPKKIFLTHGNMLKSYMNQSNRLETVKQYDYMAALGPYMKKQFIKDGVDPAKLVDIGIARTDEVVKGAGSVFISDEIIRSIGVDPNKKIVSYMPTFWGASSIYDTGEGIIRNFPEEYTLLFRPHPQTPRKIINQYLKIIRHKNNVSYIPEGYHKNIGLLDIFLASSVIIGDVSSVMLEAILTKKPLIFAYGSGEHKQSKTDYAAIEGIVEWSQHINIENVNNIRQAIDSSLNKGVNKDIWKDTIDDTFYHPNGTSTERIAEYINGL